MTYEERKQVYLNAYIQYGEAHQLVVATEELSECIKEICKFGRGIGNAGHLAEEVADSMIMLEQVIQIFGIDDMVSRAMEGKVCRLDAKLKGEGES